LPHDREPIVAEALSKRYGDTLALDALDLTVRTGEVYGYLGPNGAGKTTTIRLLLGLHRPSAGRAELFGVDAWRDPVNAQRRVAYMSGEPFLWPAPRARGSDGRRALACRGRAHLGRRGTRRHSPPALFLGPRTARLLQASAMAKLGVESTAELAAAAAAW
jgi:energy-coupling factor transporter ATP-binding protein EcfA2